MVYLLAVIIVLKSRRVQPGTFSCLILLILKPKNPKKL
jgi:hypothetical protein